MINPKGKKLEKLLFRIFDDASQGVDTYNHNGSLWLIFTDEMRWVVEYTKEQILWYNYSFFKQEMEIIGLDCVENKDLIQKWFESRFLNINSVEDTIQNGVKHTFNHQFNNRWLVEDTIQNGVKHTKWLAGLEWHCVEDTIQNGVKDAYVVEGQRQLPVKDTIQNGVKHTFHKRNIPNPAVEDTIQNGVKHTLHRRDFEIVEVEDTIQNGVKHCEDGDWLDGDERFEDIIQNGEKK